MLTSKSAASRSRRSAFPRFATSRPRSCPDERATASCRSTTRSPARSATATTSSRSTISMPVREIVWRMDHRLLGLPGATLAGIRAHRGASHRARRVRPLPRHARRGAAPFPRSTPASPRATLRERGDTTVAAIAPPQAAERYGLVELASNIADHPDNFTRFLLVEAPLPGQETPSDGRAAAHVASLRRAPRGRGARAHPDHPRRGRHQSLQARVAPAPGQRLGVPLLRRPRLRRRSEPSAARRARERARTLRRSSACSAATTSPRRRAKRARVAAPRVAPADAASCRSDRERRRTFPRPPRTGPRPRVRASRTAPSCASGRSTSAATSSWSSRAVLGRIARPSHCHRAGGARARRGAAARRRVQAENQPVRVPGPRLGGRRAARRGGPRHRACRRSAK